MDLEEFRTLLTAEVRVHASAEKNFVHSAFVEVLANYLAEAGEVADFLPCYYRGTVKTKNVSIDGYAFDKADDSLRVFLASPTFDESATLTQTDARTLFKQLCAFVEEAASRRLQPGLDENSPANALAEEIADSIKGLAVIRAYLITDARLSQRVKDWPEGLIAGVPVDFHIWDLTRFHRAFSALSGQDDLVVSFETNGSGGLPCLEASNDSAYASYLCIIPGQTLAQIYETYGSRLLEGNVRSFLTARGKINKGIRNTLLHSPEMFFAYNNGIAATASEVEIKEHAGETVIASARDFQIVNGGQTTASLATAKRNDRVMLDNVSVPMKLSIIEVSKAMDVIPLISRYANSQNKVSDADFFSNHEFHRRIEQISRRSWAPAKAGSQHETHWYYERARGQYANETVSCTDASKRRFFEANPRDQLITKTDLAKSENSWAEAPHRVSRGAQSNFLFFAEDISARWEKDKDSFGEAYFRAVVARMILFRSAERIVSQAEWYSGGYRANIVTYSVAYLSHKIGTLGAVALNAPAIWQRQVISSALTVQLGRIAESVYGVITSPTRGRENVTQWCKTDECWSQVKAAKIPLTSQFADELIPLGEAREEARISKLQQKVDSSIGAQTIVVGLGPDYWLGLLEWAKTKSLIGPEDERLVRLASGLVGGGVPNDKQCKRLLTLKSMLEGEGLAPASLVQ